MDDNRSGPRCIKRLRAVLAMDEGGKQVTVHGKTQDVSLTGLSFVSKDSLRVPRTVTVYVLVGPGDDKHAPVIFEAQGRMLNCVLSPQQGGFRLGIQFTKIAGDGKKIMQKLMGPHYAEA